MKKIKVLQFLFVLTFAISCGQQKKFVQYKVKEGETMRQIARSLGVKTKDLLRINPDISQNPAANTLIFIPKRKNLLNKDISSPSTDKKEEDIKKIEDTKIIVADSIQKVSEEISAPSIEDLKSKYVLHEVKPKETVYGLKRFYNITQEELLALNPELKEGLKIGQIIKIKPIFIGKDPEILRYEDAIKEGVFLKAALMLPFKSTQYDTISPKKIFRKSLLANIVTDFYLGTEIAIDSLKSQGIHIELNVFDTEKNSSKIGTIIAENDLSSNDVIIGPIYSEEVETLVNNIDDVPVVFPVYSKNQSNFKSENIIKTSPEKKVFREELVNYILKNFIGGNIIVVSDQTTSSLHHSAKIKEALENNDQINTVHVLSPEDGYIEKNRFLSILPKNTSNWVVLATNDNVIVADAINSLISLPEDVTAKVFTFDKGTAYDKIDNSKLAQIGLTYISDQYIDEESYSTKVFNKQYFAKNNVLPSFYATKGFDITYDILIRLASGNDLISTFKEGTSFRIESKYNYITSPSHPIENTSLFIVQYNKDLSLIRLK